MAELWIRLLGGFAVDRGGRTVESTAWRLRKARTLVKLLALAPEQRLHRDVLVEALWPDRAPNSAVNNLHQALHVARRVLAGDDPANGLLELREDFVVLLATGLVEVDVRTFERLAALGRTSGDLADLRAAVAAYAGDLLPEDRFEDWAVRPREALRATFGNLLVDLADAAAAAGQDAEAFDALTRALAMDPLHEQAVRSLMRRHGATGRSSEALAQYERLRTDLRTAYGTDPDPETQRLYQELLTGTAEAPTTQRRHNLAPALTSFVGREREIADVHRLIEQGRLVTLTGVGGAGKTRLAEETARRLVDEYADGVWIADLVPVADPHLVADTVAAALGLDPAAGSDSMRTLITRVASRNLLLVLDNCEHLLAACAGFASAVRRSCPGVSLLATSREPLHAPGEVTFRVPSLELPEPSDAEELDRLGTLSSVRLFVDRAQDVRPGFVLDPTNATAVVEICRCLDGIPLALELAAARASHLEAAEIAARLGEALSLLGRPGEVTRHATLRATLEWSHALLSDDEQVLLRRLAVFSGSFSLRSAEEVCVDDRVPEVLDVLGRLVDKSLLMVDHDGPRSRYRLLETIRQFAHERLVSAHEAAPMEAAHCRHFLELAADEDPERSGVVVEHPQLLDADHDNLRGALGWALRHDHERALLLGLSLSPYWLARGHFSEGAGWLERVLEVAVEPSRERARAIFALAILLARSGLADRLARLGDEAVAVAEQSGDPVDLVTTRVLRGTLLLGSGDLDEIERIAEDALVQADALGAAPVAAAAQGLSAMTGLFREDAELAQQRFEECLRRLQQIDPNAGRFFPGVTMCLPLMPVDGRWVPVFEETFLLGRRVGAVQGTGYALSGLADAHRLRRDLAAAQDAVRRSVDTFKGIEDAAGLGHALNHLGCIERDQGLLDPAERDLREALRIRQQLGDRRGESLTLANLGLLAAAAGDPVAGRRLTRAALDRGEAVDDAPAAGGALLNLAVVELLADERRTARILTEQAVEAFHPQGYLRLEAWTRLLAAELAGDDGDGEVVDRHVPIAAEIFTRLGCRIGTARVDALLMSR
ncbi:BTAD domain-containing putative transcriptional regulator [Kribbella sp. NPDC059898]|uniref:BTAD domain-containing putative transcriptional regulator n=1 Tax=Kribbella sp. NPDC059898 TaxID=3346995 RepID=UPI0036462C58